MRAGRPNSRTWRHLATFVTITFLAGGVFGAWLWYEPRSAVVIRLDRTETFQTIIGWGASSAFDSTEAIPPDLLDQLLDDAVDGLGLNRFRYDISTYRYPWEPINDDDDPFHINPAGFDARRHDVSVERFLSPLKRRVEPDAPFELYLSDGMSNVSGIAPWLRDDPEEYAEQMLAMVQYLDRHGIRPQYYVVQNEPGNDNVHATSAFHARVVRAAGPRLRQAGLPTRFQFVDGISARSTWAYVSALADDRTVWPFVGLLSYHMYGRADPYRARLAAFGRHRGLPTAQTETMSATIGTLFDDLERGDVSVWELAFGFAWYGRQADRGIIFAVDPAFGGFERHPDYWAVRQVTRYVRPGARRFKATSTRRSVRAVAFDRAGATTVTALNRGQGRTLRLQGLPDGKYDVSWAAPGVAPTFGPPLTPVAGTAVIEMPAGTVVTVSRHETDRRPVFVGWRAEPASLTLPTDRTVVSVEARDPEGTRLAYRWSIAAQPAGAAVTLETPAAPSTVVRGLSVPGRYVVAVDVQDAVQSARRTVGITVSHGNRPPYFVEVQHRNPARLGQPASATDLRAYAIDPEQDDVTYRWRLVSAPAGSVVEMADPAAAVTRVTGLHTAGIYEFDVAASDGTTDVRASVTVQVYPERVWTGTTERGTR